MFAPIWLERDQFCCFRQFKNWQVMKNVLTFCSQRNFRTCWNLCLENAANAFGDKKNPKQSWILGNRLNCFCRFCTLTSSDICLFKSIMIAWRWCRRIKCRWPSHCPCIIGRCWTVSVKADRTWAPCPDVRHYPSAATLCLVMFSSPTLFNDTAHKRVHRSAFLLERVSTLQVFFHR